MVDRGASSGMENKMSGTEERCRLVLIVPELAEDVDVVALLTAALAGGDVASVILPQYGLAEQAFQAWAEKLVPIVQEAGAAAMICGDTRVAGRAKADGLHITGPVAELQEAVEKFAPKLMVGAGTAADRHQALEVGEVRPDYIFFGKLDGDFKPEAHPKNVALGEWWSSMIEIPCIVMGGTDIESVVTVAESGCEFVGMRLGVFSHPEGPRAAVAAINAALDEKAPRFEA